ncbi:hypothetical protein LJC43_05785, partial [Parabacteroides sp. OttesenSCG-928-G21]|nr:hypothetical protein [Parabacteroides sp. OttesenSCG-928-G21]
MDAKKAPSQNIGSRKIDDFLSKHLFRKLQKAQIFFIGLSHSCWKCQIFFIGVSRGRWKCQIFFIGVSRGRWKCQIFFIGVSRGRWKCQIFFIGGFRKLRKVEKELQILSPISYFLSPFPFSL